MYVIGSDILRIIIILHSPEDVLVRPPAREGDSKSRVNKLFKLQIQEKGNQECNYMIDSSEID